MKNYILGMLMFTLLMCTSQVGYTSDLPKTEKVKYPSGFVVSQLNNDMTNYKFLAQAELQTDSTIQVHSDADAVVSDVANVLNIKVDTVESVSEIVEKGTYYIENPPTDNSIKSWYGYIVGILGFLAGIYFYVRQKFFSK